MIKPEINPYYIQILEDMQNSLKMSRPGKKIWSETDKPGWAYDYSMTERSTFPHWSKFFYETTPKNKRVKYLQVNGPKPYEDGYFNGNTKELLRILKNSEEGYLSKSPRLIAAWEQAINGYLDEIKEWEHFNQCDYYDYELLKEYPF